MSVGLLDDASFELPLYRAAADGDIGLCQRLLDDGADVNERTQVGSATALIGAARHGHADTCRLLLNRGADVDATDDKGNTALHHAAFRYHKDVCHELIEADADVSILNIDDWTAEDVATFKHIELKAISEAWDNPDLLELGSGTQELIQSAGRRQALRGLSERISPVAQDMATPEQALAARQAKYGRAM